MGILTAGAHFKRFFGLFGGEGIETGGVDLAFLDEVVYGGLSVTV